MKGQFPWIGRSKGSAGGMTTCKINDKNVMRAKAFEVSNPKTQAQTTQRNYFKELSALVATFTPDQLRTLFPNKPKAMGRRNALMSQLSEDYQVSGTTKSIKFSDIDTLGNARTYNFGTTTCSISGSAIGVALAASVMADTTIADNYFVAAIVNVTKGEILLTTDSAKVSTGALSIALPSGWSSTDTVHAIPLVTNSTAAVSSFGSFIIKVRPEKTAS